MAGYERNTNLSASMKLWACIKDNLVSILIGLAVIGLLLNFYAYYAGSNAMHAMEGSTLASSLQDPIVQLISTCLMGSYAPLLIDMAMDYWFDNHGAWKFSWRVLILFGSLVPNVIILLISKDPAAPWLFVCLWKSQELVGIVLMCCAAKTMLPENLSTALALATVKLFVIQSFFGLISLTDLNTPAVTTASSVFFYSASISFLLLELRWFAPSLYILWSKTSAGNSIRVGVGDETAISSATINRISSSRPSHAEEQKDRTETSNRIVCNLLFALVLLYVVIAVLGSLFSAAFYSWADTPPAYLIGVTLMQMAFVISVVLIPGRLAKWEAIHSVHALLEMKALLDMKRIFVRFISHELRSPMSVVMSGLELVREDASYKKMPDNVVELIEDSLDATSSAVNVLNDMLHYESMDAGSFSISPSLMPASGSFITSKLGSMTMMARKKNIQVTMYDRTAGVDPAMGLYLNADEVKVHQVIRNMLSNAVKFTPALGDITVTIDISIDEKLSELSEKDSSDEEAHNSIRRPVGTLSVSVKDTGAGIAKENHDKVFGQFSQFNANELQGGGGSGLGLWISKQIAELHGGRMYFKSDGVGTGTTFTMELPLLSSAPRQVLTSCEAALKQTASSISVLVTNKDAVQMQNDSSKTAVCSLGTNMARCVPHILLE
jgi:signal transduction histidine kinase